MAKATTGMVTLTAALLATVILEGAYVNVTSPKPYVQRSGEALIRYTGLSGWVIETRHHIIVIDYVELQPPRVERAIWNGYIDPEYLEGRAACVFVTHGHGDHYWPPIRDGRGRCETYGTSSGGASTLSLTRSGSPGTG
jgi:hypothetical protein